MTARLYRSGMNILPASGFFKRQRAGRRSAAMVPFRTLSRRPMASRWGLGSVER